MKKNRPGVLLTVLCQPELADSLVGTIFEETTTIGVRIGYEERMELKRSAAHVDTPFGRIAVKRAVLPGGGVKTAPEYESCRNAAKKHDVTAREVFDAAVAASITGKHVKRGKAVGAGKGRGGKQ